MVLFVSNWDTTRRMRLSTHAVLSLFLGIFIIVDFVSAGSNSNDNIKAFRSIAETFSDHSVIKPQLHHARHKRAIKDTFEVEEGGHTRHITLSYHHHGHKVVADLHLNENLIPEGHFLRFQNSSNGADTVHNFTKADLCHYQGTIRGKPNSSVAVSTCNGGVNGVVYDEPETYFIHSRDDGSLEDDHFLFKHEDLIQNAARGFANSPGHDVRDNYHMKTSGYNRILRYRRSNAVSNIIQGPYNTNKQYSFVELVIVADRRVFLSYGASLKKVQKHCQDLANIINALYVPQNIYVALVGVVVWNEKDEIEISRNVNVTLMNFLHYRRSKLSHSHPNDNAQLLTKEFFTGGITGNSLEGSMCSNKNSGGVCSDYSPIVARVATTMAHSIGHNLGLEHDTRDYTNFALKLCSSGDNCENDQLYHNKTINEVNSPQCGLTVNTRIYGGQKTEAGQFPWIVRIAYFNIASQQISYECAGSAINDRFIVTAAHCVTNLPEIFRISHIRHGGRTSATEVESRDYDIERTIVHENYNNTRHANDIALVRLTRPLNGGNVIPICLPTDNFRVNYNDLIGKFVIVAGWDKQPVGISNLQFVKLAIVNRTTCASKYDAFNVHSNDPIIISESQLCAQKLKDADVCQGDSGSPLMDDGSGSTNRFSLLGVVSFGPGVCGENTTIPGVYTSVQSFTDWILSKVQDKYKKYVRDDYDRVNVESVTVKSYVVEEDESQQFQRQCEEEPNQLYLYIQLKERKACQEEPNQTSLHRRLQEKRCQNQRNLLSQYRRLQKRLCELRYRRLL